MATVFGLIYAVLVDRTRFEKAAKALIFLPLAISMVGASIIWKFVYDYRPSPVRVRLPKHAIGYSPAARSLGWRDASRQLWGVVLGHAARFES